MRKIAVGRGEPGQEPRVEPFVVRDLENGGAEPAGRGVFLERYDGNRTSQRLANRRDVDRFDETRVVYGDVELREAFGLAASDRACRVERRLTQSAAARENRAVGTFA